MVYSDKMEEVSVSGSSDGQEVYGTYWETLRDAPSGHNYHVAGRNIRNNAGDGTRTSAANHSVTPVSRYYSVEDFRSSDDCGLSTDGGQHEHDYVRRRYFYGQLSDAMRRSIWWSLLGSLVYEMTKSYHMIAMTRAAFNASLIFGSLFADVIAESQTMSKLLSITVVVRACILLILVPASYCMLSISLQWTNLFMLVLTMLMAIDGCQEAIANTSDLIYKGIDRLSHQYDMMITEETHAKMSNAYQIVFDLSFTFLIIPLAILAYILKLVVDMSDLSIISILMGSVFLILTIYSLCNYYFGMSVSPSFDSFLTSDMLEISAASLFEEILNKADDIMEGMRVSCSQGYLMKRIIFLAMETAFEHTIVSLAIPIIALTTPWISEKGLINSNILSVLFIAVGKLGGSLYTQYVAYTGRAAVRHSTGINTVPNNIQKYLILSCASLLLLPLSLYMDEVFPSLSYTPIALMALGIFLFFAFSSYPKSVLASSIHIAILSHPLSYKIFDFVGFFITFLDMFVLLAMSFFMHKIEGKYSVEGTTFSITLFYALHCLYQLGNGMSSVSVQEMFQV